MKNSLNYIRKAFVFCFKHYHGMIHLTVRPCVIYLFELAEKRIWFCTCSCKTNVLKSHHDFPSRPVDGNRAKLQLD